MERLDDDLDGDRLPAADTEGAPVVSRATAGVDTSGTERRIGRLLPGAVSAELRQGDRLAEALRPVVERSLRLSARTHAPALVDALSGVVGPALWKAHVDRIQRGVLRVNRYVLVTLTPRSLRWRMEAAQTGRPFAAVLRERMSRQRVKQVFLIHRRTGLLLESATREDVRAIDGDMVSAMLTAIQDFAHDSFGGGRRDRLERIQVGSTTVWIEQGPLAILAGVVEGEAPPELREAFRDTLDRIHTSFGKRLDEFDGDVSTFAGAKIHLDACVRTRLRDSGEKVLPLTWAILLTPVLACGFWGVVRARETISWNAYVNEISRQPGIVVLESGTRHGQFYVKGLRDPMALDPVAMLAPMGLKREAVASEWEPYLALIPEIAVARARQVLDPPQTVTLEIRDNVLYARGDAPDEWIERAHKIARGLPGIADFRVDRTMDREARDGGLWEAYVRNLRAQPGIVVLEEGERGAGFFISGLRDPAAVDPVRVATNLGLDPQRVRSRWEPYMAFGPTFVAARAQRVLAPPATVTLKVDGETLRAEGSASHRWIADASLLARGIPGLSAFDASQLRDTDMERVLALKQEIEAVQFRFLDQAADLWPGQSRKIDQVLTRISELDVAARQAGKSMRLELCGLARSGPDEDANQQISLTVAQRMLDILERRGADTRAMAARGVGANPPASAGEPVPPDCKRCVFLRVNIEDR